jgi:hypothetical protein
MMSSHEGGDAARKMSSRIAPGRRLLEALFLMPEKITGMPSWRESTAILTLEKNRAAG